MRGAIEHAPGIAERMAGELGDEGERQTGDRERRRRDPEKRWAHASRVVGLILRLLRFVREQRVLGLPEADTYQKLFRYDTEKIIETAKAAGVQPHP